LQGSSRYGRWAPFAKHRPILELFFFGVAYTV